ncbi:FAD-dependent oxidoreductase [Microvirga tunisiensis]|uniref:FAD-dependent oxidoreductase n=1 Tax=Pannonibacter tanglangensis TaxID=2750084 RepID=A0A7X5F3L7_9HYPH|nr:FAD-dependent oxidoreductase [Pannonibacter sp. XCT-53]NBN79163.1 FAD-dependent oxidoreductase [Pannonibacter sp. XCT-53]
MSRQLTPDICVIGAGSAGLSVAAGAAAFGVPVVLVERAAMGGDCLNTGCIPSKSLLAAAGMAASRRAGAAFGVAPVDPAIDFAAAKAHLRSVISAIAPHDSVERFEGLGVTVVQGEARFTGRDTLAVGETTIRARRFVIATGSHPFLPPVPGLETVPFLTNESIFGLEACPEHLLILGGGPIGLEMAQAHRRLGARVTVLEAGRALSRDDEEHVPLVIEALKAEGVEFLERTHVARVEPGEAGVVLTVEWPEQGGRSDGAGRMGRIEGSHLLVATGRAPSIAGLGLDLAGVEFSARGIKVDEGLRTSNRRIYAIGDVVGGLQFTHVANYHAGLVLRSALFRLPAKENREIVPWVTYTTPEIAQVGLLEAEARKRYGTRLRAVRVDYAANDRAQAERRTTGKVKLLAGPGGRLVGASLVGANAGEMANLLSLAVSQGLTMKQLAGFIAPYPTYGEILRRAALAYYAEVPKRGLVRAVVRILRLFG